MLDPATARLCVWRLPLEAAFRLFSKLGSLGGSIRERFSRTGRTRPALARPVVFRRRLHRTSEASCTTAADEGDPSGNNGAAAENWQPKGLSERPSFFGTPTSRHNAASAYSASVPCQQCLGIPALFRAWGSGHWTPPVAPQVQLPHQNMRPTLKHYDRNVMVQRC